MNTSTINYYFYKMKITIIGAGLSGLSLTYLLKKNNINATILEARERIGGRILTTNNEGEAPTEMGATWVGSQHTALMSLLKELNIGVFEQAMSDRAIYEAISTSPPQLVRLPPNNDPSYRIQGGTSKLIQALADSLDNGQIQTGQIVKSIKEEVNGISITTNTQVIESDYVVSTLPPFLLMKNIEFQPTLPKELLRICGQTHTWMGESIKIGLSYAEPFWRKPDSSGTIFSNVGPIPEMYDHSDYEDKRYALKGFLNGAYYSVSKEERLAIVLRQLNKYFGDLPNNFLTYEETVWRNEPFTFTNYDGHILPHQNNGHAVFQNKYLADRFFVAGAETSAAYPGYMEGAVRSAAFVSAKLSLPL
jgi:monoamine oxidase